MPDPKPNPYNPALFYEAIAAHGGEGTFMTDVSLRDLFAAFALAGILARPATEEDPAVPHPVETAFAYANSMLGRREGP